MVVYPLKSQASVESQQLQHNRQLNPHHSAVLRADSQEVDNFEEQLNKEGDITVTDF